MVLLVKQWTIRKFRDVLQLREFGREFLIGDDQEWRSCQFNESKPLSARTWAVAVTVESDVDIRLMHDKRSEEHTSELQPLICISYAVFCLTTTTQQHTLQL